LLRCLCHGWCSKLIIAGELARGLGLILGAFAGVAATGAFLLNTAAPPANTEALLCHSH
jgi:hypothetical protein